MIASFRHAAVVIVAAVTPCAWVLTFAQTGVSVNQELTIDGRVVTGSSMLDLAGTNVAGGSEPNIRSSVWTDFVKGVVGAVTDKVINDRIDAQAKELIGQLWRSIPSEGGGLLLKVNVPTDALGVMNKPGGQLVSYVDMGTDPMDAMANYWSRPAIQNPRVPGPDASVYVWITKSGGQLTGRSIPSVFSTELTRKGHALSRQRALGGVVVRAFPKSTARTFNRAQFWLDVQRQREADLKDAVRAEEIRQRTARIEQRERTFKDLYENYQRLNADYRSAQARLSVLDKLATMVGVFESAWKAGQLLTEAGDPVPPRSQSNPHLPDPDIQVTKRVIKQYKGQITVEERTLSVFDRQLNDDEKELIEAYKNEGVSIQPPTP
jgi:hypothetical protein